MVQQSEHQHKRGAREVSHAGEQERAGAPRGDSAQKVACAPTKDSAEAETSGGELRGHGKTRVA